MLNEAPSSSPDGVRPWAPLQLKAYRRLWFAQASSNLGMWMLVAVMQWVVLSVSGSALLVSLVQTATTLPMVFLAAPAGVLADVLDRRSILVIVQLAMACLGGLLALAVVLGHSTAGVLLSLTFLMGCGAAFLWPAWQAVQPELVPRTQLAQATSLGAVNLNLARVIGPAVGGGLIAVVGAAALFALIGGLFGVAALAVASWSRSRSPDPLGRERILSGLGSGARYVRNARSMRLILLRVVLFVPAATALWALLPLLATRQLNLAAQGFGVLLAALGVGALLGALVLPALKRHLSFDALAAASFVTYALCLAGLAFASSPVVAILLLGPAGAAWLGLLSTLNAMAQLVLPEWVRARALSYFLAVFGASQAVGGLVWGFSASLMGLRWTCLLAAGVLVVGVLVARGFPLEEPSQLDPTPSVRHPPSEVDAVLKADDGPILVTIDYRVRVGEAEAFGQAMQAVARVRKRTGARHWALYWDPVVPQRFVETFLVASWEEHRRQHLGRMTVLDRSVVDRIRPHLEGVGLVSHLVAVGAPTAVHRGRWRHLLRLRPTKSKSPVSAGTTQSREPN